MTPAHRSVATQTIMMVIALVGPPVVRAIVQSSGPV